MKTTTNILFIAMMLLTGTIFSACQSSNEKRDASKTDVLTTSRNNEQDKNQIQRSNTSVVKDRADVDEWYIYKKDTELSIKENELKIVELKEKQHAPGRTRDPNFSTRIEILEKRNDALQARLDYYNPTPSDWKKFKTDFNRDMEELGDELTNFSVEIKN